VDKSFQLIRTNPRLTTNIKLVVDSNYNLYFESFNSSKELSNQQYKHYLLNKEAEIENEIPKFYAKLPKNIAFTPKSQDDADVMYNEYVQQFDNTYFSGANEVDDQWYKEEFEYFAPLHIKKGQIPKKFIILRVDEPSIYKLVGDDYVIGELDRTNFRSEIINKWKCVSVFDLSNNTNVGKFFDRNINDNTRFPDFSFFFDTKPYNYSKWGGLEYETGVYKISELFLDDKIFYENGHFNLEEFITKGFEDNGLLYPYIFNIKFLFDDSPATPTEFKKWSMNRYYGFYAEDFELVKSITSVVLPELKSGLIIKNNIFLDSSSGYTNPYVLNYTTNNWIQVDNDFYEVKLQSNGSYKIISDKNLTDYDVSNFNKGTYNITNNFIGELDIDKYIAPDGTESDMYADLYLINIMGEYHVLGQDSNANYYIRTDYNINSNSDILNYYKGGFNNEFSGQTSVINSDGSPIIYNIYRVKLTDIKDFDFDRIHTHYSDFDYEKSEYVDTPEVKLYANEYRDSSIPVRKKTHDIGEDGQYKLKNISSEYSACDETFEIIDNKITSIFEKNQSICKWGYDGSISHSDYSYKLNNNSNYGGIYNRTTNTLLKVSNIKEKTLDYFYRIGELYGKDINDVITGFTSTYESEWDIITVGGTLHSWHSNHIEIIGLGDGLSITLEYKIPILYNELYSIELIASNADIGATFQFGVDPSSFQYGFITGEKSNMNISFIGKSLSNTFKIFVNDADIDLYSIKVTKIVDKYYLNQSTNIQTKLHNKFDLNTVDLFNLDYYINSDFDYFDYFFKNNMYYENSGKILKKPYLKYSVFGGGDNDLPATTLFKGIEYKLYNVEDMVLNTDESIRNIITQGGQNFNGYKFSVILSENYKLYDLEKNSIVEWFLPSIDELMQMYTNLKLYNIGGMNSIEYWSSTEYSSDRALFYNFQWGSSYNTYKSAFKSVRAATKFITSSPSTYPLRSNGPNGGWIFYILNNGDSTWTYFECSPSDLNISTWSTPDNVETYATETIIDWGLNNTLTIIDETTTSAAKLCYNFKNSSMDKYKNPVYLGTKNTSLYDSNNRIENSSDSIHIFLNDKYKNILVIINKVIAINNEWGTLNNIDKFGENHGLYYGKTKDNLYDLLPTTDNLIPKYNPNNLSASYYMDSINNLNVKNVYDKFINYHYIDIYGNYAQTEMIQFNQGDNSFSNLPNWTNKFPLFYVETNSPNNLLLKKKSYITTALRGPETNIYDKFLVYSDQLPLNKSYIDEPLSRKIEKYETDDTKNLIEHGEKINNTKTIFRYVGYYEPIFKDLSIFDPTYYWVSGETFNSIQGNYVFGDYLTQFGMIEEILYSKVNEYNNYLKLKNTDTERSYYPMVDEIGLSQTNRFIFLSPWDRNFFIKTLNEQTLLVDYVPIPTLIIISPTVGQIISSTFRKSTSSTNLSNGVKIYGYNYANTNSLPTSLTYMVNIKNKSEDAKSFKVKMYYKYGNLTTVPISVGVTDLIPKDTTIGFTVSQLIPNEIQSGTPEEYTSWYTYFICLDMDDNILDTKTYSNFKVYNNLINFTVTNNSIEGNLIGPHITGNNYNFKCDVTSNPTQNKRISNLAYYGEFWIKKYNSSTYYKALYTTSLTMNTSTNTVSFNNVPLNISSLEWPNGITSTTNIEYRIIHSYDIEGVTKYITGTYNMANYSISGAVLPPNLIWNTTTPSISKTCGECNSGVYSGDRFTISNMTIKNTGGPYTGTLTYNLTLYDGTTAQSVTRTINKSNVSIGSNATYTYSDSTVQLGPTYTNETPLLTSITKTYKAGITVTQIGSTIKYSSGISGCRDLTTYVCNPPLAPAEPDDDAAPVVCLDENTLVTLANGTTKAIKYLHIGEKVLSYKINNNTTESLNWVGNISDGIFDTSIVKNIVKKYVKGYYVINDSFKATPYHNILTRDNTGLWKWISVNKIKVGNKLFKEDGTIMNVNSIVYLEAYINIVKLDVENTDNYFAGGILNHNAKSGTMWSTNKSVINFDNTGTPIEEDGNIVILSASNNVEWEITDNRTWINSSPDNGTGTKTFTVGVSSNANGPERYGRIFIDSNGLDRIEILINQEGGYA
jgi:hypothetical protein